MNQTLEIESEQQKEAENVQSAENVGQEQPSVDENKQQGDESKTDDASVSVAVDSGVGESIVASSEQKTEKAPEAPKVEGDVSQAKIMDGEGSDTTVEEIDSDFDNIEEVDPSYGIDANLWKSIRSFDEVDLKPPKAEPVEGEEPKKEKKEKVEEVVEEDSGIAEFYRIRTEKEKDQDFKEYIRELCRPQIISYLPDRVVPKGSTVRLTCTVQGNNIQTRWMKGEVVVERGKKVQIRTDGEIHILEITDITEREAGDYTAYFKNRAGEVETSSRITVFDGSLHKPDHLDIALVKDYYDHSLGGLVIEAHVHGLPAPTIRFYKDNHLLHARKNKIVFFTENKEIYQCLMVRPDVSVSGTYTILAENSFGKRRFNHHVNFETKYPLIHLPMMRHADKKLDDFIEEMLEKVPKPAPEVAAVVEQKPVEPLKVEEVKKVEEIEKVEVPQPPKPEEIVEALQAVVDETATEVKPVEKPKKKKSRHHHKKKKRVEIDSDLVNDGEDETEVDEEEKVEPYKRKFSTVVHESYEPETFRIYNTKQNVWFSGQLRDQTAIEGSTIKLFCTVSGPLPIIRWNKNGKPVPWSQTIRNMSGEGIGHVIIEKLNRRDAGVYTCVAKNAFNEVETSSTVKVIPRLDVPKDDTTKPLFTRILCQFYHITEDDLVLDTHVRGVPQPEIKWYKDGIELNKVMDERYDIVDDHDGGYQFRIHKPVEADSALYACEALNSVGKAKVTCKVQFSERDRHTHPKYVYHKESMWQPTLRMSIEPEPVPEKEEFIETPVIDAAPIIVEAAANSTGGSVNVQGSQDGATNGSDQNGGSSEGGDAGGNQQNGSSGGDGNEDGEDKKDDIPKDSDAQETEEEEQKEEKKPKKHRPRRRRYEDPVEPLLIRDSIKKISFAVNLRDIIAPVGSNLKLCCQVAGPGPQVKWFKNGKPLDQSPKLRVNGKEGLYFVTIAKADTRDSGVYRFVASNNFNTIESTATVEVFNVEKVEVKPTFTRITDYYRQEVDDLIIEVQVRGVPTPKVTWARDGVELDISDSGKFLVMREPEGVYKLCIHDPSPLDSGRFIVEASNSAGKEEIRKMVRFLGKEHYKYLPGICHADPKKPHEEEEGGEAQATQEAAQPEAEAPAAPAEDEILMDKWGNVIHKVVEEKKIRLREKVFMPPSKEELAEESLLLKQVRHHIEFESELKNIVTKVGSKVKLLCTVVGASPSLTWFKNDEPLEFAPPKIKNTSNGSFGSVTFLAVNPDDEGVYKCVASNEFVEVSSECTLTVVPVQDPNWIKPTFTRNLKEFYDQKSNDLILEVHVRGYPRPRLTWNKDGLDVEDGDDKFFCTRHPDGVYRLNIHDPMIKDSGRYGCSAVNEAGVEDFKYYLKAKCKEDYIHTAGLYHADPTQFAKYKEEEERKRQERLAFRPPPRPKPEEKAPEVPQVEEKVEEVVVEEETEYETTDTEYDEEGEVIEKERRKKVKAPPKEPTPPPKEATPPPKEPTPPPVDESTSDAPPESPKKRERNWMQGAPDCLPEPVKEVQKKPKYQLEFLTPLENRTGVENTAVKLFCQISGPRPEVIWLNNGEKVALDDNVKNMSNENVAALSFIKARPEHSGEYTCIVKNRECKIEATCTLTILEVPKQMEKGIAPHYPFGIKHSFNSQTDELIIETVIRGTPRLFIKWYKDARELENDDKYLMSRDGETYKLYVHKPTFRDSGIYLIQSENTYGMEFLKYVIEFEQKDTPVVSGFIYHADLTKTKKYQDEEERKRAERNAYRPPPLPVPELEVKAEEPVVEVVEEVEETVEEESEYETTDTEYDEEGEMIEKERRKKVKAPPKEPTPPPKEPTPPPKEPTPPPKEPTPPPKEPTPPPKEPTPPPTESTPPVVVEEPKTDAGLEGVAAEPLTVTAAAPPKKEIEKPLHVFRAHKVSEFRKNADVPIEIIKRLISTVAKEGSKIKLSCHASEGDPRIKAFWFKNEEPLEIDVTRMKANVSEDGLATLEIMNTQVDDSARYKVTLKMKKGEISSECDVSIYEDVNKPADDVPPTLVTTIVDGYRPILNDVFIEIRLRGYPKPVVSWVRDGLPIDPWKQYKKYQIKHDDMNDIHQQTLIINEPNQYRDSGKYIIIAQNRAGTFQHTHMLEFEGKKVETKRKRMDDIFIVNEVPRVNPKPRTPTPPPVKEPTPEPEPPKEEEVEEEAQVEEEEEEEED